MKTCFVIIPFRHSFDEVCGVIEHAARECRLKAIRGDLCNRPGSVLPQVQHEIRRAAVVVVDITGHNPNVFYELGIAHQIKGPERVLILTQEVDEKKAYDIHQYRQLPYEHTRAGLAKLRKQLPVCLRRAVDASTDEEFWNVIRGRLPRTLTLVRDLKKLIGAAGKKGLRGVTIRIAAGLSSISISDNERTDAKFGKEYHKALLEERNTLREVLLRGAQLKAVLNPPRRFTQSMLPERLNVRFQRLIGLVEGRSDIRRNSKLAALDVKAMKKCRFALSPVPMPNLFIIGDKVAYEGMKRAGTGGFEMTHCETDTTSLREMIDQFDMFFEDSYAETRRLYPTDAALAKQLRTFYDEATDDEAWREGREAHMRTGGNARRTISLPRRRTR
ncbi:MAG TPA: hypothetical protein PLX89_18095 [Verrucomicrobiota bacterium]|nr:hypothetical protein [Verrucomicrobiales bacterium]HRI14912.1 hypothetical protein [Verrucomicrobiota bacterium]